MEGQVKIKTVTDQIIDHVRKAIFSGRFLPGSKIKENELSKWFGVSRTPIREALRVLESEGLVEIDANKGARTPLITKKDIDEVFEFRVVLETYCIRKFTKLVNEDEIQEMENLNNKMIEAALREDYISYYENSINFHGYYVKKCQNKRLYIAFSIIRNIIRGGQFFLRKNPDFYEAAINEHKEILEALRKRDSDECERILREHLIDNCERMKMCIDRDIPSINELTCH